MFHTDQFLKSLKGFIALGLLCGAFPASGETASGALRVEVITAYNLVVDSNAGTPSSYAPRSAYIGATFYNDGSVPLTDLVARIGDYKGGVGDTPGLYPTNTQAGLEGPLPGGAFALTHEGGSLGTDDATRYIPSIPAGKSVTVYWLVGYPQTDIHNVPTWGTSVKPDDDLKLFYDVWATAKEDATTRTVDITRSFTCRNEISASANKIFPNGANKVPEYYKELMNQYSPSWTNANYDGSVGSIISTDGIWYDFGNVGAGFDNNGDLVPDKNAWMQPVGDPSTFDASAFRLVRTYAFVIVKLKTGGELVLTGQDKLYFENIPENNGAVGYVRYQFMPLQAGASSMTTPYQEVASGDDNEKFNADYGVSLGEALVAGEAHVGIDKTASVATVASGGSISYTVAYTNTGAVSVGNPEFGLPLVVQDAIPAGTTYSNDTAAVSNTLPAGVTGYHVFYSTDGGNTWTNAQPTPATAVTHLQWWLDDPLAAGAAGVVRFSVTVDNPYQEPSPIIPNVAGLSFGNTPTFTNDTAETRLLGTNSVGDTVYADTGDGPGGYLGNGIQDGTEPGISNITVRLYSDVNTNGLFDAGEPLIETTSTATNGTYLFSQLADGRYAVVVDTADPDMPYGYTVTTPEFVAVDLDSAGANSDPVSVLTADFGFAPALVLSKRVNGSTILREGQLVNYTLTVTNNLVGDGSGVGKPTQYRLWAKAGTTGTGNKAWTNPSNAYQPVEPDGQYAIAPMLAADEWLELSSLSIGPQLGDITSVRVVVPIRVTQPFDTTDDLTIVVRDNGTAIAGTTLTTNANLLAVGVYEISFDISAARAWTWTSFGPANTLSIRFTSGGKPKELGVIEVDAAAFELTSTAVSGETSGSTTLDPVPLDDFYDTTRLHYVSAIPAVSSVTTNSGTGTLHWDNLGPIYAGGGSEISVTFKVLEPTNNIAAPLTNTASVTEAYFLNGVHANQDEKWVTNTVLPAGTIGDFVWRDLNTNGVQELGEPGIPGVTVQLLTNGVLLATAVTDASGLYLFEGLTNSANYTVTVVSSTLPGGSGTPTFDRDGIGTPNTATGVVINVTSTNGADTVLNADFGYNLSSLIRGTIWHDRDRDAYPAPESGEELLGGVTVRLYAADGTSELATTTTAANGTYTFMGAYVTNGTYFVRVDTNAAPLGASWQFSYDSDQPNNASQVTVSLDLGGEAVADYSYYQVGPYAVGDTLFYDWDGDGYQDEGVDTGIAAVTVWIYQDENTNGLVDAGIDALIGTNVTSATGFYSLTNLVSGTYLMIVDQADTNFPALYLNTYDPYGAADGRSVVTISNASNWAQDFGYQPYGFNTIGDTVWYDANADGVQSGGSERGLANVTVRLSMDFDGDGTYTEIRSAVTDANGRYLFESLPDGAYRVTVDTESAGLPSDAFGHPYRPTTPTFFNASVAGGQQDLDNDFGFAPLGAIGDTVFWDNNANGQQDWTEPGITGVIVRLYFDVGLTNGVYDPDDTQVGTNIWTDASGRYLFSGLNPGNYVVVVDPSSPPLAGAILRADPEMDGLPCPYPPVADVTCDAQTDVNILPGTSFMGADFGYQPLGVIGDLVWVDLNTNGLFDAGESGIPYVTVILYDGNSIPVATNETDGDGYYSFGNQTNGTYHVVVQTSDPDFPSGLTASFDADGTANSVVTNIVISGGHVISIGGATVTDADLTIDFGYRYVGNNSLSGTVGMDDPTYDGVLNGSNPSGVGVGEYPFANQTVYLYLWNDAAISNAVETGETTLVASTLTDLTGDYHFENLPGGDGNDRYIVSLAAPRGNLLLTTEAVDTGALWIQNTTNAFGITLSAYQVVEIIPVRENVDFAFRSTAALDFGDLPVSYSTTIADQPVGPSHTMITDSLLYLGSASTTTEANGQPSATATADGGEDGVVTVGRWQDGAGGGTVTVTVQGTGWLIGWVDFNGDGTFTNMNERVIEQTVSSTVNGGVTNLTFDIPAGTFGTNGATVLNSRFRLYPETPVAPMFTGEAAGGEVEDHQFVFGIVGNIVWEDLNGNGIQELDSGEGGVSNVTVRLYDSGYNLIETMTTLPGGLYAFTGLPTNTYYVTFSQPDGTLFTKTGVGGGIADYDSDADPTGVVGAVSLVEAAARLDIDAGLYIPALVYGYVFKDSNDDLLRNTGDGTITNALVRLLVNGVMVASTNTDSTGYYRFENIPVGSVTVLVSRVDATLIDVPSTNPAADDPTRNRALPATNDAYIPYGIVSGYGVLAERPAETLNFGFKTYPFSTAIDFRVAADGKGGVLIDLWTVNESGYNDIVIYAWIGNAWVEVGRVPSGEVYGEGSNRYTVYSDVLPPEGSYYFRIIDEAGHVHDSPVPVEVAVIALNAVRFEMETVVLGFTTAYGNRYSVKVSDTLSKQAADWETEFVSVLREGVWSEYSNRPFMAGTGTQTQVRVPINRKKAFFKIVQIDE